MSNTGAGMTAAHFAELMRREIDANEHKGEWIGWVPDDKQALGEMGYHVAKLCFALGAKDAKKVTEYCADIGNIVMKIVETFGEYDLQNGVDVFAGEP